MVTRRKSGVKAAEAIDEQLERYRSMRDFTVTEEPSGAKKNAAKKSSADQQFPFVIQKHAASHLHYDFRLGWNGILKSWAIAKGPSYMTSDKRLAVQVEDHPIEYGGFEGIIPKGQYGGGTVMVWDQGTWEPQPGYTDVDEGLGSGSLKFTMHGKKMKGNWALVRMGGKAAKERKPNWLLIKEHDDFERTTNQDTVTEAEPDSVVTGRSLEEIASSEDHVWNSKETARGNAWYRKQEVKPTSSTARVVKVKTSQDDSLVNLLAGTPQEKTPVFLPPQLAQQAATPPVGEGWLHELKLDGYRIQARKDGDRVQLLTRTGLDWTHRMKTIAAEISELHVKSAVLDGEVVVLADNGTTSFADLQAAFQEGVKKPLTYFVFDLLHLDGHNLRGLPLVRRKEILAEAMQGAGEYLRHSEHIETEGAALFHKACELHAEGIISKRSDGIYRAGRNGDWLKLKCVHEQEFVIGGFTLPSNGIHGVGALLLGYYEGKRLIYAGRTGTGFTQKTHRLLRDKLEQLKRASTTFEHPPAEATRGAIWVKPELVAQVSFATWTADNLVRQAAFKGLREDKPATEVLREEPMVTPKGSRRTHASHAARKAVVAKTGAAKTSVTTEHAAVRLTHPNKVLDAESGLTKQQLADYYWAIAPYMLPQIADRPISLVRCPEGTGEPCFFQKHANHMLPEGIETVDVPDKKTGKIEPYITVSTREALAGLAQMGVMEVHPWGSRNDDLEHPDRIIFDLDPDTGISWETLAVSAAEVRKRLKRARLESFLKTTGGKGLHVVAPIKPEHNWSVVKDFSHTMVLEIEKANPALYLTKMSKAARKGRIFLDYLRNERGATAIAAYSPRARTDVTVSLPLTWSELKGREQPIFRLVDFKQWKKRLERDPWKQMTANSLRQVLQVR